MGIGCIKIGNILGLNLFNAEFYIIEYKKGCQKANAPLWTMSVYNPTSEKKYWYAVKNYYTSRLDKIGWTFFYIY
jgi:hypothetical protein